MKNPEEFNSLLEQMIYEEIVPIEEQLTIIDTLDGNFVKLSELNEEYMNV